jgi:hypothetical protein
MKKTSAFLAATLMLLFCLQASDGKPQGRSTVSQVPSVVASPNVRIESGFGKVPLQFIPNEGQVEGDAAFYVQGRDKVIFFEPRGLTFALAGKDAGQPGWAVKLDFVGANGIPGPESLERSDTVVSFFKGAPEDWKTGLRASTKIIYRDLWPGVDLVYSGTYDRMKYEFVVLPGADPSRIRMAYRGAGSVRLTADGRLAVDTPAGGFEDDVPVAWQDIDGTRRPVRASYALADADEGQGQAYGFSVGDYDRNRALVLDPAVLVYCGYLGGTGEDRGSGIAVDASGSVYLTGYTQSAETTFPVVAGPDTTWNTMGWDAYVAKLNPSGTAFEYCGYIGGDGLDWGRGIAVDASGNAYVSGHTRSTEASFPVAVGPDLTHNGGMDAFVAKVNPYGTALEYCGYIGGDSDEFIWKGISVDGAGSAYITGNTYSTEATFPVAVGPDLTHNGGKDGFVAKVSPSGAALEYCGFVGGEGDDDCEDLVVSSSGSAFICGMTMSSEATFPVVAGPDLTFGGSVDGFVAEVRTDGTGFVYCGYIGGRWYDECFRIAIDSTGSAYVTGATNSTEASLPVAYGPDLTHNGDYDVLVAKVAPGGSSLLYCGYIGGPERDVGAGIAVDATGHAFITGEAGSTEATFPIFGGPDLTHNGGGDGFIAKLDPSGVKMIYCGFIGGLGDDYVNDVAADSLGNAYVTGYTLSSEATFPVLIGPDLSYNGMGDAFVAKIEPSLLGIDSIAPSSASACDPDFTLTVTGSDFLEGAVVTWDGSDRVTTFVSSTELLAQIGTADLATSRNVAVAVRNPDDDISDTLVFTVSGFALSASPTSATVTAGQAATYTVTITPQLGPYNNSLSFSCSGLPARTTAAFSPSSVTPGADIVTTTLTLTTQASSSSTGGTAFGSTASRPPAEHGILLALAALAWLFLRRPVPVRALKRWVAAGALVCLMLIVGGCSADGGGDTTVTGTPKGTYQITVNGSSGCLTSSTVVTLKVE